MAVNGLARRRGNRVKRRFLVAGSSVQMQIETLPGGAVRWFDTRPLRPVRPGYANDEAPSVPRGKDPGDAEIEPVDGGEPAARYLPQPPRLPKKRIRPSYWLWDMSHELDIST